ncbi:MAG: [FeFe] hydrogenase, group A [Coxiellaceae bacterium]|jgi:iron-only hydrogenase group A|nr:[FeFe] hydrogenase, group A [Coxiellaceae bacterium]
MSTDNINLTIDGHEIVAMNGTTIMQAAEKIGVRIPRLCYHPKLSMEGSCRVCIVKVKGIDYFVTSCGTVAQEGMEIQTNSPEIRQARRDIVELLIDNHPRECQICERDANCELQNLAYSVGVRERLFTGKRKRYQLENSSVSVVRDSEKCILCGRCLRVCHEIQGVSNLSQQNRGFSCVVTPAYGANMDDSVCVQCGQCINVCPTAAFQEKRHTDKVWEAINDPKKFVVVQTAPAIRAAIGEGFDLEPGTPCTGKMITALRRLGFDVVFDTDFAADLTIMEEAHELIGRMKNNGPLPHITSCSPGWINFVEGFYPELLPHVSTCRSPMTAMSAMIKTYYANKIKRDPKDIFVVAVMPCVAKKFEMERQEFTIDNIKLTDAVMTTRELNWMIKSFGIDFAKLPSGEFDSPLGESSGAGVIFGATGGVLEAVLRTAAESILGKPFEKVDFESVRVPTAAGLHEEIIKIGDHTLNLAVANGLVNAKKVLDAIKLGTKNYHVIEIMACLGGCIGGGGQPYPPHGYSILDSALIAKRAGALYSIDASKKIRRSYENRAIQQLYQEFLGKPGSDLAHQLLHTSYRPRTRRGIK